ncbi:MAG: carbonic anhydrase family protein [Sulfuricurvum sp.]|uniref:carbonic anhydrase n=1 Tax=Sulfuricurvum sp. TaxID=2025608 RepID=UPI00262C501F|nr:carbonic anhydrase family protein [Sulfuricurvum sp.]MDD2828015.1 carbonic anhydrase family protein [Sulfuricurvum sp.]MDD4948108.1 carbonic anhydrase family protein [Sulfuricurvum sp.]
MNKILLAFSTATLLWITSGLAEEHHARATHEVHWDYDKNGPDRWGEFGEMCGLGKAQSPINIISKQTSNLDNINTIFLNESLQSKASVVDNGHAIQVNVDNGGTVEVDGVEYKLVQFHFHGKSEEQIDGKQYDLVAHMVHKSAFGSLLVIAVLFEEGKSSNPVIQTMLNSVGKSTQLNPANLLPKNTGSYYHFMGSLTTPPCSENVKWYVMKEVQNASKEQIAALRKFYNHNYRPVQPLNGRVVESK